VKQWAAPLPIHLTKLAIEVIGPRASAMLSTEAGLHTCLPVGSLAKKQKLTMEVSALEGLANRIPATFAFHNCDFVSTADARRHLDPTKQLIRDFFLGTSIPYRSHPENQIVKAIVDSHERRIMALLDDELREEVPD
jgi:hypothetical protein